MQNLTMEIIYGTAIAKEIGALEAEHGTTFSEAQRRRLKRDLEKKYYYAWLGGVQLRIAAINQSDFNDVKGLAEQITLLLKQIEGDNSELIFLRIADIIAALKYRSEGKELTVEDQLALSELHRACQSMPADFQQKKWFVWLETFSV